MISFVKHNRNNLHDVAYELVWLFPILSPRMGRTLFQGNFTCRGSLTVAERFLYLEEVDNDKNVFLKATGEITRNEIVGVMLREEEAWCNVSHYIEDTLRRRKRK